MSADVLDQILANVDERLEKGEYAPPEKRAEPGPDGARFVASLREPGVRIIAEIKRRSPSAGEILPGADGKIESFALAYRRGHAAAISVVTDESFFGGNPAWIPRARRISGLPVLMKDFIISERQLDLAAALGADAVLLIVRALKPDTLRALVDGARQRGLATVVEAHGAGEIPQASQVGPDVLGVNARDLASFRTDLVSLEKVASAMPPGPVKLAESGIRSRIEVARLVAAGFDAFLVGEALLRSEDPEELLRELRGT